MQLITNRTHAARYAAAAVATLVAALALLVVGLAAGWYRGPIIRMIAAHAGRDVRIEGQFDIHLWSRTPSLVARQVIIGNPSSQTRGTLARIDTVTITFEAPSLAHWVGIKRVVLDGAVLSLVRDAAGRANWQNDSTTGAEGALIRSFSMIDARVTLDDPRRHLQFDGTVSVTEKPATPLPPPLRIEASGSLNGRPASIDIVGDPLATADRSHPYHFEVHGRTNGAQLAGKGLLERPFALDELRASFTAGGIDLKNVYFLTGVSLVHTGEFRLTGAVERHGTRTAFNDLRVTSGESDMHGTVSIETAGARPLLKVDLASGALRAGDVGQTAASRALGKSVESPLLFSDAAMNPAALRRDDMVVAYHADRLDIGRFSLESFSARARNDAGVIIVSPVSAALLGGSVSADARIDARTDHPTTTFDIKATGVALEQFPYREAGRPPLEGALRARVKLSGQGRSLHQILATANGTLTAMVPHGAIRSSLAELMSFDLRGLGLKLVGNDQVTRVRCGIASFEARDGVLHAQRVMLDTDPVLVTGNGSISLGSETLDLLLYGRPKQMRIRIRAPLAIAGTFRQPTFQLQAAKPVPNGPVAKALDAVVTPIGTILGFIDPGLAQDADCSALSGGSG